MLRDPHFQIEKEKKITVIIALLYILSPIDLLPDAIPFLGMLDDVLVAGYALQQVAAELERYKHTRQPTATVYRGAEAIPESDNADADFETSREDAHAPRQPA